MKPSSIIPTPLKKGSVIGIVAPAGQITDKARFEQGLNILHDMGFEPRFPRQMWPGQGYLADTDDNRAEEIHKMLVDPEIDAVMAMRGGYGCIRLLDKMNFDLFRQHPKMFIGFSDISVLLNQIASRTGMVSFHGPVVTSLCDCSNIALERFYECLKGNWRKGVSYSKIEILKGDTSATGTLLGGNLSTLMTTLGTPADVDWDGAILLLEDIGEPIYKIDRMLTQLHLTGKLKKVNGIVLGDFRMGAEQDSLEKIRYTEYIWRRVLDLTSDLQIPVWGSFPSGHFADNLTLPLGAKSIMDYQKSQLQFQ
ncbi:S66 peptidase family protein [Desulfosediminicola flagellatus]|uniref:S66 peptidase family protein n=1 Tax=Desulfosediminicola flagellatus TaxID=2569541 RepID=UPI0010AD8E50|nr:LD-carboxypeptidase [Desulfosediminicola flagellatus]